MSAARRLLRKPFHWARWVVKHPRALPTAHGTLLHVGCGQINDPRFVNIDAYPHPHIHFVRRVTSPRMWRQNSADLIYASHVFEHVERRKLLDVLRQWHGFLRRGGILRLSVPDFDAIVKIYALAGNDVAMIAPPLMGGQETPLNVHYAVFNQSHLTSLLEQAGFHDVRLWDPARSPHHDFTDTANLLWPVNGTTIPISLNLEAVK